MLYAVVCYGCHVQLSALFLRLLFLQRRCISGRTWPAQLVGAVRYYRQMWEAAINVAPAVVSINSFNNWHDGTQVRSGAAPLPCFGETEPPTKSVHGRRSLSAATWLLQIEPAFTPPSVRLSNESARTYLDYDDGRGSQVVRTFWASSGSDGFGRISRMQAAASIYLAYTQELVSKCANRNGCTNLLPFHSREADQQATLAD
jgi:hypothetical protein